MAYTHGVHITQEHPQIVAMRNLVGAYQHNDIREFEKILRTNRENISDDSFMKEYIADLLTRLVMHGNYSCFFK